MKISIKSVGDLGAVSRLVRKKQCLDQVTAAAFAGSGVSFVSQFENGKEGAEIGRVLSLFDALGIEVSLDLPFALSDLSLRELTEIDLVMGLYYSKKVQSVSGPEFGYVVSQTPDLTTGTGFDLRVAWGASSFLNAQSRPMSELVLVHSSNVRLV